VGRKSESLIIAGLLAGWVAISGHVHAQPPGGGGHRNGGGGFRTMRDRWYSLSPEDRQVFRRNAERWMRMGPEERNLMRERERLHQLRLKQEADAALRDAGLRLDQQRRELFEQRYLQERRKIERELSSETEAKRKQQLPALNDRLKKEFQQTSSPGVTSSPVSSATPKR
jgi:hypothetical protein